MEVIPITTEKKNAIRAKAVNNVGIEDFFVSVIGFIAISSVASWILELSERYETSGKSTFTFV